MKRSEFLAKRQNNSSNEPSSPNQPMKTDSELLTSTSSLLKDTTTHSDDSTPSRAEEPVVDATIDAPDATEQSHIVTVTFAPDGMKAESRRLRVGGSTEQEAVKRAIVYYKKAGNKVYDAVYIKKLNIKREEYYHGNYTNTVNQPTYKTF